MKDQELIKIVNGLRVRQGFRTIEQLVELCHSGNVVYDPFSTLVSASAALGTGNVLYPGVIIEAREGGMVSIGNANVLHQNTYLLADGGTITVGNHNEFGDGGVAVKANRSGSRITIGDYGRYVNGPEIVGTTNLGSGTQVIGRITVQDCNLAGGEPWSNSDPDVRGAVLKGMGVARAINLHVGDVLQGYGNFSVEEIKRQSFFHPRKG